MKTIEHKTKIIEFEVSPCSKIDDIAKDWQLPYPTLVKKILDELIKEK